METAIPVRHIACEGAFNVRDLGGYETLDGRRVRWRRVFRADGLHRVPVDGAHQLVDLGWRTVLDLRTASEVDLGRYAGEGIDIVHLPILSDTWEALNLDDGLETVPFLVERYLEMLDEGASAIAAAVEILASKRRLPAVFHCSAGKDRTGVVAALVLSTLGVDDVDIAADYHLSALAMDRLMAWFAAAHPELVDVMAQQPKQFLQCPPEAMFELLERVRNRHGSAAGYLVDAGVSSGAIDALRDTLLER